MLKIILVFLLIPAASFGANIVLEKHRTSGFTIPEHSFVKDCKIYRQGYMEATTVKGDGTAIGFSTQVSPVHINVIRVLNKLARKGSIVELPAPCDGGNTIIQGRIGNSVVELETTYDCGTRRQNSGPAASALRTLAETICQF